MSSKTEVETEEGVTRINIDRLFPSRGHESTAFEIAIGALLSALLFQTSPSSTVSMYIIIVSGAALLTVPLLRKMIVDHPFRSEPDLERTTNVLLILIFISIVYLAVAGTNFILDPMHGIVPAIPAWTVPIILLAFSIPAIVLYEILVKDAILYALSVIHNRWYDEVVKGEGANLGEQEAGNYFIRKALPVMTEFHNLQLEDTEAGKLLYHRKNNSQQEKESSNSDKIKTWSILSILIVLLLVLPSTISWFTTGMIATLYFLSLVISAVSVVAILGFTQIILGRFGHTREEVLFKSKYIAFAIMTMIAILSIEFNYPIVESVISSVVVLLSLPVLIVLIGLGALILRIVRLIRISI